MNSNTRRDFLKQTGILMAGSSIAMNGLLDFSSRANVKHLGVQLWSVRDDMNKDPKGTIEALAKMGYKEVEGFGYDVDANKIFGIDFKEYLRILKANGISMPSCHMMVTGDDFKGEVLSDAAKKMFDAAAAAGQKYVVCPYMRDEDRSNPALMVKAFDAAGRHARKAGVRFAYHNHNFEFTKMEDGRLMYEWLLQEVDPKNMGMEMDIYWVNFANHNPLDWFRLYPGRFELCHVKDMSSNEKRESIEVGDGVIDFNGIFKERINAGFRYYIIELEHYVKTPLEGVKRSHENFTKKLKF
jgi:sugar phosphate isomerase/epimerase